MVDLSLFLPVVGAVVLLAVIVGLLLWRRNKKAQAEAEAMDEPVAAPRPVWDGTVGAEYRPGERASSNTRLAGTESDPRIEGWRNQAEAGQASSMQVGRLEDGALRGQGQPETGRMAADAALTRVFTELAVKEQEPIEADEPHDDEAALREALIQAAASRRAASLERKVPETNEAPIVEAVSAQEVDEVEATAEEAPPMVEAMGEEEHIVEAVAVEEAVETREIAPEELKEFEVPMVTAEAAGKVEEEIPVVEVEASESSQAEVEGVAAEPAMASAEAVREGATSEAGEVENVPEAIAEAAGEATTHAVEFGREEEAVGAAAAREASEPAGEGVGEDGQTTFFTFEDLNFQPVEDAKPGEEGLGLSLEEAAAVLASGPVEPRKEEARPHMEELFPALVKDEGPEAEEPAGVESAREKVEEAIGEKASVEVSKMTVGRKSRLKKITLGVPVLVRGPKADPARLREVTQTLIVLPQGAVVSMGAKIGLGEEVNLVNLKTGDEVECRVVGMKLGEDGKNDVEVEFLQEMNSFWPVSFPGEGPRGRGREAQMAR